MTVEAMREQMTNAEFVCWSVYYGRKAQRIELAGKAQKQRR